MVDPRELTPEQEKAWKSLKRAFKRCEQTNIYWYQVLESLHPLNGNVVEGVADHCGKRLPDGAFDFSMEPCYNRMNITCSFADDAHHAILK